MGAPTGSNRHEQFPGSRAVRSRHLGRRVSSEPVPRILQNLKTAEGTKFPTPLGAERGTAPLGNVLPLTKSCQRLEASACIFFLGMYGAAPRVGQHRQFIHSCIP